MTNQTALKGDGYKVNHGDDFSFKVAMTGPDHEPTTKTKWYAQVVLVRYDLIPVGVKTYAFGPTPESAMTNLANYLRFHGVTL